MEGGKRLRGCRGGERVRRQRCIRGSGVEVTGEEGIEGGAGSVSVESALAQANRWIDQWEMCVGEKVCVGGVGKPKSEC